MIGFGMSQDSTELARRIKRVAIAKLPRNIQSELMTAALGADPSGQPPESSAAHSPRYVFVVKAGKPLTFNALREVASPRPDLLGVTFDRRWMGDRRLQQGSGHVEQRRRQRRGRTVDSEWLRSGFVLSIVDTSQGEVSPARAARHPAGRQVRRAASPVAAATSPAGDVSVSDAASVRPPAAAPVPMPAATESREAISPIAPAAAAGTPPHAERMAKDVALAAESAPRLRVGETAGTREPSTWGPSAQSTRRPRPSSRLRRHPSPSRPRPGPSSQCRHRSSVWPSPLWRPRRCRSTWSPRRPQATWPGRPRPLPHLHRVARRPPGRQGGSGATSISVAGVAMYLVTTRPVRSQRSPTLNARCVM